MHRRLHTLRGVPRHDSLRDRREAVGGLVDRVVAHPKRDSPLPGPALHHRVLATHHGSRH